jgi:hypothetical protein
MVIETRIGFGTFAQLTLIEELENGREVVVRVLIGSIQQSLPHNFGVNIMCVPFIMVHFRAIWFYKATFSNEGVLIQQLQVHVKEHITLTGLKRLTDALIACIQAVET